MKLIKKWFQFKVNWKARVWKVEDLVELLALLSLVGLDWIPFKGKKVIWWNQRMRLQRLQAAAPRHFKHKSRKFVASAFKVAARQAVCPFCYKAFYDKSTMNRHVAKRVCLGMAYNSALETEDLKPSVEMLDDIIASDSKKKTKAAREPCPYCKKLLKGKRGVRKHLDFYGCPMANVK